MELGDCQLAESKSAPSLTSHFMSQQKSICEFRLALARAFADARAGRAAPPAVVREAGRWHALPRENGAACRLAARCATPTDPPFSGRAPSATRPRLPVGRSWPRRPSRLASLPSKKVSPRWILDCDVKSCFDEISHEWLVRQIAMESRVLRQWLMAGFMDKSVFPKVSVGVDPGEEVSLTSIDVLRALFR